MKDSILFCLEFDQELFTLYEKFESRIIDGNVSHSIWIISLQLYHSSFAGDTYKHKIKNNWNSFNSIISILLNSRNMWNVDALIKAINLFIFHIHIYIHLLYNDKKYCENSVLDLFTYSFSRVFPLLFWYCLQRSTTQLYLILSMCSYSSPSSHICHLPKARVPKVSPSTRVLTCGRNLR